MRGAVPNGVVAPLGDTSVTVSPTLTRSELASRVPMAIPSSVAKLSRVPNRMLLATSGSALMPSALMPRTTQPSACTGVEAITCPSIRGMAVRTVGTLLRRCAASA